jgi:CHASE3 domain sensor protein
MNTTKSVYNKLFKEEATELASQKVELASLDMVKRMADEGLTIYKKGVEYAKEMEAFTKKSRVLNADANALADAIEKELKEFEAQAKQLGLDVTKLPEFKNALNALGPLDNIIKMTAKFK